LLRLEGFGPSVKARALLLEEHLASLGRAEALHNEESLRAWRRVIALEPLPRQGSIWWRVCVPPARGSEVCAALAVEPLAGGPLAVLYDWGGGLVWIAVPENTPESLDVRIRSIARALGGHARAVHAGSARASAARGTQGTHGTQDTLSSPALRALTERVKSAFDPAGVLNPGIDLAAEL
jgi:glycolate oxidase FAD binding subunit